MNLARFLHSATILDGGPGVQKADVIARLLNVLAENGDPAATDVPEVHRAMMAREQIGSTGIGRGIALPHAVSAAVERPVSVLAVARPPVAFDSLDGEPVDLIVLTVAPPRPPGLHLGRVSSAFTELRGFLRDAETCERLRRAPSADCLLPIAYAWGRYEALHTHASPRKRQLFACACVRFIEAHLVHPAAQLALAVAERFADGQATEGERASAIASFLPAQPLFAPASRAVIDTLHAHLATLDSERYPWMPGPPWEPKPITRVCCLTGHVGGPAAIDYQIGLLDCLLPSDPLGQPRAAPAWLAWDHGAVRRMAEAIYRDRSFADLPILADALEEAGCADIALLDHLHSSGPHARGCWAVDMLLGKG
ncbi:MAG: PTS sugar transporter subunit IIA [Gemmataceae bacterium]